MKSRFKPYPEYKDSGVEWLGEIPEGWDMKRLKYLLTLSTEKNKKNRLNQIKISLYYKSI